VTTNIVEIVAVVSPKHFLSLDQDHALSGIAQRIVIPILTGELDSYWYDLVTKLSGAEQKQVQERSVHFLILLLKFFLFIKKISVLHTLNAIHCKNL